MLTRAHDGGARRQSSFPRLSNASSGRTMAARASLQTLSWLRPYPRAALRARDEARVRERIERTGTSDAKKRASYPLAKRAGARCVF